MSTQQIPQIQSTPRQQLGTRASAALRTEGRIPAVIYGHKQDPDHVSLDRKLLTGLLHHHAHLVEVTGEGQSQPCLIKDVQWDHLGSQILHVDLTRVDLTEQVVVEVEIELVGEAVGLKESGAYLEHPATHVQVKCLASQIPDSIRVDISQLGVGESITVGELSLPQGVSIEGDPEAVVASVHLTSASDETEAVAEATDEPELIGKKDKPETAEGQ